MKIILFFMSGGDHGDRSGDRKNRHYPQTWKPKGFRYTQTSPRVIARIRRLGGEAIPLGYTHALWDRPPPTRRIAITTCPPRLRSPTLGFLESGSFLRRLAPGSKAALWIVAATVKNLASAGSF